MSLTFKQWEDEAKKISSHKRADLIKAIKVLNSWPAFKSHYDWTGFTVLKTILECENQKTEEGLKP